MVWSIWWSVYLFCDNTFLISFNSSVLGGGMKTHVDICWSKWICKNGRFSSFSISTVHFMFGCCYLKISKKLCVNPIYFSKRRKRRLSSDTFVMRRHGLDELHDFFEILNQQHPRIERTMEIEKDGKLSFLIILIYRKSEITLEHQVYKKSTHENIRHVPLYITIRQISSYLLNN